MTETYSTFKYAYRYREGLITAVSAGFVLVVIGALFIMTPALFGRIIDFFNDFDLVRVPNTILYWPAPARPLIHSIVYTAVERFSFAVGVFQIVILALRFGARSPMGKKAETAGNLVFWLGFGYLTRTLLLETTRWTARGWSPLTIWFVFWAAWLMLLGLSLIVRAIILAATMTRKTT